MSVAREGIPQGIRQGVQNDNFFWSPLGHSGCLQTASRGLLTLFLGTQKGNEGLGKALRPIPAARKNIENIIQKCPK